MCLETYIENKRIFEIFTNGVRLIKKYLFKTDLLTFDSYIY